MCGILVFKEKGNNDYIKHRGVFTNKVKKNGLTFIHNLLPVTGEFTPQPFIDEDIVCLYNGEIYNQPFLKSDGECLIPLYKKYGIRFIDHLDGEFAIALYNFKNDLAIFATDRFGTKPLWRNGIECASYQSGVGGTRIGPNEIQGIQISTGKEIFRYNYHKWDWNQFKTTYDDWISAFDRAVKKRATNDCFIGLSSGYDSGAINCSLKKTGKNYKAFIIERNENKNVLRKRKQGLNYQVVSVEKSIKDILRERVESVPYNFSNENTIIDDVGAQGLAQICKLANQEGRRVLLSGQGADEIIGDYALYPEQSNFKGKFPEKLEEWENFTGGFQRDYLNKEEYVGGAFSIETRYPFLDTDVVQEFLWLTPELKNKFYKAPIREYLIKNNIPFDENVKRGFRPL